MHCPKCGQQQISEETRFCSRCGLLLSGVAEVLANNGIVPAPQTGLTGASDSAKRRGIKQGVFLFLLSFLVVPLLIMFSVAFNIKPFLPIIAVFLFGVGGILRMVYAMMFESGLATTNLPGQNAFASIPENRGSLPSSQTTPASAYVSPAAGSWRDTNDLQYQPGTVTDSTTKLLEKEEHDQ